jgi:putative membrane protein
MIALHAGPDWLTWHPHPDVILVVVGMLAAYWYALAVWQKSVPEGEHASRSNVAFYCTGVFVIYAAAGSPIHDLSEQYLLSMHMVQHMLFTLVAPPLLLAGIPNWLYQKLLCGPRVKPVATVVLNPLLAIFAFNMLLVISHLPHVVDYALTHHWFHFVVHVGLVTTGLMMWWPVITKVPGLPQLSYPYQMAYLFVQSLVPAVVGSFITFSNSAVYEFYAEAPRIWGLTAVQDQQAGAFVMKVIGSLIIWAFIAVAFFRWYAEETASDREDRRRADSESELREIGLTAGQ